MDKVIVWEDADFTKDMDETIVVDEVTVTYSQQPDCTEDRDGDWQELKMSTRNNGIDRFFNLSTTNWSISGVEDLIVILEDFKKRAGIKDEKEKDENNA